MAVAFSSIVDSKDNSPPVLFFVPVGISSLQLMEVNVGALSKSYPRIEYFFAHYDGAAGRKAYSAHEWYRSSVGNHSCAYSGMKPQFIYKELVQGDKIRKDSWLKRFRYFWFADDNIDFSKESCVLEHNRIVS
jgi:hypothetical protein